MGKSKLTEIIYRILSFPFLLFSQVLLKIGPDSFKSDFLECEVAVQTNAKNRYCSFLYASVVSAEDHRFHQHYGLDFYSILRAIVRTLQGRIEGGSTIEQQFVRTVTLRYERTLLRKIIEQLLAVSLSRKYHKTDILSSYISIAYYGHNYIGVNGVRQLLEKHSGDSPAYSAISIAARLKYPEPSVYTEKWGSKFEARRAYLVKKA